MTSLVLLVVVIVVIIALTRGDIEIDTSSSSTTSSSSSTPPTPSETYLAIHSSDCLACTLLASVLDAPSLSDERHASTCCIAVARIWPGRVHECVALCEQLRLLRRQQFRDVECEMLSLCRFNEQQRLAALHRVRDERARLARSLAPLILNADADASVDFARPSLLAASSAAASPPVAPVPPELLPPPTTAPQIDALQLEQLVRLEEMQRNVELEAVRLAQARIDAEKRLAAELRADAERERERERREAAAAAAAVRARGAETMPASAPKLSTTTWPYMSSPTVGAVLWSALSDCFWLPLLLLWFLVDYASDRVTTHYLSKAFETEHPLELESAINRYSALFVAAQRSVLAAACVRALSCSCEGGEIFDALFAFRWSAPSIGCLHTGDGCWLHFVVAVTAVRCATALVASVRTFMSYWGRQRVWQWLDSMVWLTDAEKPTNVLVLLLLALWPSRWKLTVALVTVYIVSSIVDALTSVALDLFTKRTMEDLMSLSWWHVAIMAHKVLACWLVFSHIHRDDNNNNNNNSDDTTAFAFVVTLMLLTLTAAFARAVWKKLLPKRKFARD